MKIKIYTLFLTAILMACSGDQPESTQDFISAKDLAGLRIHKEKKLKTLNALKLELGQIDKAISDLDPYEKLVLISMIEIKPENFDHYIEVV